MIQIVLLNSVTSSYKTDFLKMIEKIKREVSSIFSEVLEIRRYLHQHPELSFKEYETSAYIKSILKRWGIPFTENIADT